MLGKFFGARSGSAAEQAAGENGAQATAVATTQGGMPTEWATLGRVPVAQCVPASPTFAPYEGQLSPVTAATVVRLMGTKQES